MVKEFLSNYFGFNKQQRNGLLVLMSISAFLLIVRVTYPAFMKPHANIEIKNLPVFPTDSFAARNSNIDLFNFDPNTVSETELIRLGLKEKTASTVIKYRKKRRFSSADDFGKVYGISASLFKTLKPYIRFDQKEQKEFAGPTKKTSPPQTRTVELNSADSLQLLALPGIGPTFAHRILKYRAILGGYVTKEQLKEVYGMKTETYDAIKSYVVTDISNIKKIDLNKDDFKTVNRHPYISYELTKELFNKKRQAPLTALSVKEVISNDSLYQRLLPYLTF